LQVFVDEAELQTEAEKDEVRPPTLLGESFMMANLGKPDRWFCCGAVWHVLSHVRQYVDEYVSLSSAGKQICSAGNPICIPLRSAVVRTVFWALQIVRTAVHLLWCTQLSTKQRNFFTLTLTCHRTGIFYGYLIYNEAEYKALKSKGGGGKDKDKKKK
jgi:hypothetical protein